MHQPFPQSMAELLDQFPRAGRVEWIGLRTVRRGAIETPDRACVTQGGLDGDHRNRAGKRAVTLIQHEHLPAIAALVGRDALDPAILRRNIAVSGLNLHAARERIITIGTARLQLTGPCAPCSRMEEALGPGGYNAVRGHGGVTAQVLHDGVIALGDAVTVEGRPTN